MRSIQSGTQSMKKGKLSANELPPKKNPSESISARRTGEIRKIDRERFFMGWGMALKPGPESARKRSIFKVVSRKKRNNRGMARKPEKGPFYSLTM